MEPFQDKINALKRLNILKEHLTAAKTRSEVYQDVDTSEIINEEFTKSISHLDRKHQENILKARNKFLEYQKMIKKPGWKLEKEIKYKSSTGKLWSNIDKKTGLNGILRKIEIDVPHQPACDFFKDEIKFAKLNDNLKETKIVEDLKNDSSYVYHCFKGNLVVSDRDFSLFKH